jgi:hypothetical protein
VSEIERKAAFSAKPMAESFLATLLEDAQLSENEEAFSEEREARDVGTIYDCPGDLFKLALDECEAFGLDIALALARVPDGALVGLDRDCRHTAAQLGSDLYLERAGHGAGFRDRDTWSEDRDECRAIGEALSGLVRTGLETTLGDDGKLYAYAYNRGAKA